MDVGGQKYGGDVSVSVERSGCSTVCGEAGRVCASGTKWLFNGMWGDRTCPCQRNGMAAWRHRIERTSKGRF